MTLIIAARHGLYDSGHPSNYEAPLTEVGREQAYELAVTLSVLPDIEDARILVSPYLRSMQTAEELAGCIDARPETADWLYDGPAKLDVIPWIDHSIIVLVGHLPMVCRLYQLAGNICAWFISIGHADPHMFKLNADDKRLSSVPMPTANLNARH
jgi:phosphohistidine phosphatase SixA